MVKAFFRESLFNPRSRLFVYDSNSKQKGGEKHSHTETAKISVTSPVRISFVPNSGFSLVTHSKQVTPLFFSISHTDETKEFEPLIRQFRV